ncbi:MAG: UDP-2,4-diacetamido-2,4,6-trideoxy-beta-L-altropyranose hydrolase [Bacteroidia bacterium]|nr:UDP-2,4-diacetamido-2,4,6-trideoxy-beta-L-altropyranose hydrolase [Bacteroidia bacterium]
MLIYFRADSNYMIGSGHLKRSLAISSILNKKFKTAFLLPKNNRSIEKEIRKQVDLIFYTTKKTDLLAEAIEIKKHLTPCDIIVLDGYGYTEKYQKIIQESGCKIVCIDDIHSYHFLADAVINHAEGVKKEYYSKEDYTRLYLGMKYLIINPLFLNKKFRRGIKKEGECFVNMGGADPFNITFKIVRALEIDNPFKKIHLVIGKLNPYKKELYRSIKTNKLNVKIYQGVPQSKIASLMHNCEMAICPSSTIALEACSVGVGLMTGITADNQSDIYNGLIKKKCAFDLGDLNRLNATQLSKKIKLYASKKKAIKQVIFRQKKAIDGKSPDRIMKIFQSLSK